jgi:hypothetical protein
MTPINQKMLFIARFSSISQKWQTSRATHRPNKLGDPPPVPRDNVPTPREFPDPADGINRARCAVLWSRRAPGRDDLQQGKSF